MDPPQAEHSTFLALIQTHQRALLKICWAYAYSPHDRDDLLQEIAGRLWASFGQYDRRRSFSTWMFRVALNVAIDHRRRQKRWGKEVANSEVLLEEASAEDPQRHRQLLELRELLDQQTEADRALLLLHLEGHSYREIGEVLGIGESNVGTRLNRLKNSLRQSANPQAV